MATRWIQSPFPHSPVDDLESFYYTAQWATAFNDGPTERGDLWESDKQEYGAFFAHPMVLLRPSFRKLETLTYDWRRMMNQAKKLDGVKRKDYLADNFLVYGYRGVTEYFELICKHRELLKEAV